jgi:two-component system sensor histidine kinase HydH
MVGELSAGLAHEIRNPLTSMKVLLGTLLKNSQCSPEGRQDAEMIEKQMLRLEKIVDGFLGTARSLAHSAEMKTVDLNAIVEEGMLLLASASNEGTRLNVELSDGDLAVRGDATQLSQVVYNLVLNAIQAVDRRGRINVSTGRRASDGKTPQVCFEVSDDGPGIQASVRDRLFQPFVTTKKSGVGLGLSIVKRIVEAHGGRLEVESPRADIGRGALFRVWLAASGEHVKTQ